MSSDGPPMGIGSCIATRGCGLGYLHGSACVIGEPPTLPPFFRYLGRDYYTDAAGRHRIVGTDEPWPQVAPDPAEVVELRLAPVASTGTEWTVRYDDGTHGEPHTNRAAAAALVAMAERNGHDEPRLDERTRAKFHDQVTEWTEVVDRG